MNTTTMGHPGGMDARSRRTLLLLLLVCVAPVVASYAAWWGWRPGSTVNHGELLKPEPLRYRSLPGQALPDIRGRWTLVYVGAGLCEAACRESLWLMRQVRTAQGKEMGRVGRLWLVSDGGAPAPDDAGLALAQPDGAFDEGRILLVDPAGRTMLRYPARPDPQGMVRDLQRLLKYSQQG